MIAGAHRGQGSGALHYTSKTMRQEALPEATEILNKFQSTIGVLKRARRTDALTLTRKVEEMEEEQHALKTREEASRREAASKTAELALHVQLIAQLQAKLADANGTGPQLMPSQVPSQGPNFEN